MPKERYRKQYHPINTRGHRNLEVHSHTTQPFSQPFSQQSITNSPIHSYQSPPEGKESWLISYIDMLTLLVTLFVLLLTYQNSSIIENANESASAIPNAAEAPASAIQAVNTTQSEEWLQLLETTRRNKENIILEKNEDELSVTLNNQLIFQPGAVAIKAEAYSALDDIAKLLIQHPHPTSIAGHTDDIPIQSAIYPSNWELSTGRATNITRYLIQRGVPANQLRAIGYADTRPKTSNETAEGRANNRRVTITLNLTPAKPTQAATQAVLPTTTKRL